MKKIVLILLGSILLLSACSSDEETTKDNEVSKSESVNSETSDVKENHDGKVNVDKGLLSVDVTIPASFFEGEDMDTVIANAKQDGIDEATLNDDGSVTYKMSKSKHKEMMAEMAKSIEETKMDLVESGDFASVKNVETNGDYSKLTLEVNREAYENSFDGFATMSLGLVGSYYQAFNGIKAADMNVLIELKDAATGEVFDSIVYPNALEEMGE